MNKHPAALTELEITEILYAAGRVMGEFEPQPVADAQLRKALTWVSEWMYKTHDKITLDCNCGGWLSDHLYDEAKAAGIDPWESRADESL